jgi:DUF4097 and DUF4098 domain-containing protein YvlB
MRIKHVVAGIAIGAAGLLMTGCEFGDVAGTTFSDSEGLGQEISEVRFTNDSGDVKITTGDTVEVRRTVKYDEDKPGKTYRVEGGDTLVLEACTARNCWVDYDVTVPEGTKVSGHADSGSVELVGLASANVQSESGDITVRDVAGEVNASAQSGSVDLSGIGGSVVAGAESGSVTVGLTAAQNVSVRTESGDIEVSVPDASYQVSAISDSGSVDNGVGSDSSAGHKLDLRADSGDVTVTQV